MWADGDGCCCEGGDGPGGRVLLGELLQAPVFEDLVDWDEDGEELDEHGVQVEPG